MALPGWRECTQSDLAVQHGCGNGAKGRRHWGGGAGDGAVAARPAADVGPCGAARGHIAGWDEVAEVLRWLARNVSPGAASISGNRLALLSLRARARKVSLTKVRYGDCSFEG